MGRDTERGMQAPVGGDKRSRASPRAVVGLAWLLCGASLALGVLGFVLESLNGQRITDSDVLGIVLLAITFPLVGAVVAARRPRNPLGWIFCAIGIAYGLTGTGEAYALYTLDTAPGALPGGELMSWLGNWAWAPGLGLLITFALLLFPNGRLPSHRWRPVAWLSATSIAIICGPGAAWSWPQRGLTLLESNEEGLENAPRLVRLLVQAGLPLLLLCGLASVAARLVRFGRSRGVERQQLKWFAFAGVITVAGLRYRLYEIDRVINRTLVYGLLTVGLGTVYVVGVFGLGRLLNPVTGESALAVAASTLAVAALFQPARHRIQAVVDRRFNRRKYNAAKTIETFSARLRDQVELDTLARELLTVTDKTMEPTTVSLWLRPPDEVSKPRAPRWDY